MPQRDQQLTSYQRLTCRGPLSVPACPDGSHDSDGVKSAVDPINASKHKSGHESATAIHNFKTRPLRLKSPRKLCATYPSSAQNRPPTGLPVVCPPPDSPGDGGPMPYRNTPANSHQTRHNSCFKHDLRHFTTPSDTTRMLSRATNLWPD